MNAMKHIIVSVMIFSMPFLYAVQETGAEKEKDIETHPTLIHLKQQLKDTPDAGKSEILNQISRFYRWDKKLADRLVDTSRKALELAKAFQQPAQEIEAGLNLSWGLYLKGQYPEALALAEHGLNRADASKDPSAIVAALEEIGEIGMAVHAAEKAYQAYMRLKEIYAQAGVKDKAARSAFSAARANLKRDHPDSKKIRELLQEAAGLYESLGMIDRAVPVYPYMVDCRLSSGPVEDAARIGRDAEARVGKTGSPLLIGRFYLEIGEVFRKYKQYAEAERWLQKGLQACSGFKDTSWKGVLLISLGKLKQETKEYDQALEYLEDAKNMDWTKNRHGEERAREIEGFIAEVKKEKREHLPWWGALAGDGLSGMDG